MFCRFLQVLHTVTNLNLPAAFIFEKMTPVHKEAFSRQIETTARHFRFSPRYLPSPCPILTRVYLYGSLKSSNSQCTVQIIHKLHLAPGNKQHHEALSCFVAQPTSLPSAMEECLCLCFVWLELTTFQGSGSRCLFV